jgi:hypothetical protein
MHAPITCVAHGPAQGNVHDLFVISSTVMAGSIEASSLFCCIQVLH